MTSLTQAIWLLLRFLLFLVGAGFLFVAIPEAWALGTVGAGFMFFAILVEPGEHDDAVRTSNLDR